MKKTPALELRDVSYSASGKTILHTVNWTVQPGEHWAILGRNGSGKTTLLKLACGYLWPNAGGVVLRKGEELTFLAELRKSIGGVTAALPRARSAGENKFLHCFTSRTTSRRSPRCSVTRWFCAIATCFTQAKPGVS